MAMWVRLAKTFLILACFEQAVAQEQPTQEIHEEIKDVFQREAAHPWERYLRGFRRDHQFAFTSGKTQGLWSVNRFGPLLKQKFAVRGYYSKFQYSFHLPLWGGLGYFLGSSVGYFFDTTKPVHGFKPVSGVQLPGFLVGVVWNLSPALRAMAGVDYYMERFDGLEETVSTPPRVLNITMVALIDATAMIDYFFDLNWAIRMEGHWRRVANFLPQAADGLVDDVSIRKTDSAFGLGVVYHFL